MVQLKGRTEIAKAVEPVEGTYKVMSTDEVKTAVQSFNGVRVKLQSQKKGEEDIEYATMLWMREVAGVKSKLGAFLDAFTEFLDDEDEALDTKNWIGHIIRIVSWKQKAREVKVVE